MEQTFTVDPARLASGRYNHDAEVYEGEGDIYRSYSADCISSDQPIRAPFRYAGEMWVTVGLEGRGEVNQANAYRLLPLSLFRRRPTTYAQKIQHDNGESARNDPRGFFDGMRVKRGGEVYVMLARRPALSRVSNSRSKNSSASSSGATLAKGSPDAGIALCHFIGD